MQSDFDSRPLLPIVRIVGAVALIFVTVPAVDMPGGYLGAADVFTTFGRVYTFGLMCAAAATILGLWRDAGWADYATPAMLSINVAVFVPALAADPIRATLVIVWHLLLLGAHFFSAERARTASDMRVMQGIKGSAADWYRAHGAPLRHLTMAALVLTVAVVGYRLSGLAGALVVCFVLNLAAIISSTRFLWLLLRDGQYGVVVAAVPLVLAAVWWQTPSAVLSALGIYQLVVMGVLLARSPLYDELVAYFFDFPAALIVSAFAGVISIGTLLLTFPAASADGTPISPIDALFTSTSATCVTGLIVLDTPVDFSFFGHCVILTLIQIGALGIMVMSTFAAILLGQRLGLRGEQALGDLLDIRGTRDGYELTVFVVLTTFAIEALGTIALAAGYRAHGYEFADAVWHGLFHAISAFCNAGFALQSDSIVMFQEDPLIVGVFSVLIILGGLGFVVMAAVWQWMTTESRPKFDVQARIVLTSTAIFLVAGAILYGLCEWNASLAGLGTGDQLVNTIFQSVTLRTAGFNSVDFGALRSATVVFMMAFMFIGASPGSTGGGIKTTTAVILLAGIRSIARGKPRVVLFGRRIPQSVVYRSTAIAVVSLGILVVGLFLLLLVETIPFKVLTFEMVSALGTVGLSIGATTQLGATGKLIITVVMFIGRVGPLTLAVVLGRGDEADLDYPETDVMVG